MTTKGKESEKRDVVFANQLVTAADLENFKADMLKAIRKMIKSDQGLPAKKWLKSSEVRKCWISRLVNYTCSGQVES